LDSGEHLLVTKGEKEGRGNALKRRGKALNGKGQELKNCRVLFIRERCRSTPLSTVVPPFLAARRSPLAALTSNQRTPNTL
jgi:hypothetical protein